MNLANKLTVARMVAVPIFVILMISSFPLHYLLALIVFIAASITDMLDGKIARKYDLITDFGKLMDPLADKLLVISALLCLMEKSVIGVIPVLIIIARELIVSSIRAVAASKGHVIAAGMSGKIKTVVQMLGTVVLLFALHIDSSGTIRAGEILIWIATLLTVYSGAEYILKNIELFEDR